MKVKRIAHIALMAAVLCILSPIAIPLSSLVPLSPATFAVMLSGALLGSRDGTLAVAIYILLGTAGLPVFAGYRSGPDVLFGPTGGYLIGYLPLAFLTALIPGGTRRPSGTKGESARLFLGAVPGTAVLYLIGTIWFIMYTKSTPAQALAACVFPFLPGDLLKIAAVCLLAPRIKAAVRRAGSKGI